MNMKTLLGTAAGLMVATGAYAADLPSEAAPAAVDYVKVCDAFGKGYFYIPGTETCLKIGGRVRAGLNYSFGSNAVGATDNVGFFGNGRITADTMSATDLGTLHTYIRFEGDDADAVEVKQAFIQLGYVTVGRMDSIANSDVMLGDDGLRLSNDPNGDGFGDDTTNGITVMVDDLGGGFYAGVGVYSKGNSFWYDDNTNTDGYNGSFQASVGIAGQSWGGFDLSGVYQMYTDAPGYASDYYGVKGTLDLKLVDKLTARTTATYYHNVDDNDNVVLSLAAKYQVTDALDVYAGGVYAIRDAKGVDDGYGLQLGGDYTIVPGLLLTAEVNYVDDVYTTKSTDGVTSGILRLQREF